MFLCFPKWQRFLHRHQRTYLVCDCDNIYDQRQISFTKNKAKSNNNWHLSAKHPLWTISSQPFNLSCYHGLLFTEVYLTTFIITRQIGANHKVINLIKAALNSTSLPTVEISENLVKLHNAVHIEFMQNHIIFNISVSVNRCVSWYVRFPSWTFLLPIKINNFKETYYLSGVPDLFDRNKILSGGDLSHYQAPHCIRVFFYFVWFVFIHHNFQFYFELCTYCNILDIYLS